MQVGDRVKLKEHVAHAFSKRKHNAYGFSWLTRKGWVRKFARGLVGIQWDGRNSLDWFAEIALEILPLPEPPEQPDCTLGQAGRYGAGNAASPNDPSAPGRTRRHPIRRRYSLRSYDL